MKTLLLATVMLLWGTGAIEGQKPRRLNWSGTVRVDWAKTCQTDSAYADAYHACMKDGLPLVLYVDCAPRANLPANPGYRLVRVSGSGNVVKRSRPCILVTQGGYVCSELPPDAATGEIQRAVWSCHRPAAAPAPAPYYQPAVRFAPMRFGGSGGC